MALSKAPRRQERIFAFKVLYGLCFTDANAVTDLEKVFMNTPDRPQSQVAGNCFSWEIVNAVWKEQKKLDAMLSAFSENWRIERIGKVELTLLRIALYELTQRTDVPPKVALNEAVELSKLFSDDKSRKFINGILDAAAKKLENGTLEQ